MMPKTAKKKSDEKTVVEGAGERVVREGEAVVEDNVPHLDLDKLVTPAATITLHGQRYELKQWGALGLMKQKELERLYDRCNAIETKKTIKLAEQQEHERLSRKIVAAVSDIPPDDLNASECADIAAYFLGLRRSATMATVEAMASSIIKSRSGATLFPASTASGRKRARKSG